MEHALIAHLTSFSVDKHRPGRSTNKSFLLFLRLQYRRWDGISKPGQEAFLHRQWIQLRQMTTGKESNASRGHLK
jgi:hypothetical protein